MARELSQAEVLEFLCQAGGRASNAALLGHFGRLLRAPSAGPGELQRRRERFKGFVNAVATVQQGAPGAPKLVVLRKRYRELVGEDAEPPQSWEEPPTRPPRKPYADPVGGPGERPPRPLSPPGSCHRDPQPPPPWGGPPPPYRGRCPSLGMPPCHDTPHRRVHEWLEKATPSPCHITEPPLLQRHKGPQPDCPSPPSSAWSTCPSPSLDSHLGHFPAAVGGARLEAVPVFRSIRCQLSLQDLEDFVEQESPGSSSSSSSSDASRGSDSCRLEVGPTHPLSVRQNGHSENSTLHTWSRPEVPHRKPQANGTMVPPARKSLPPRSVLAPEGFILLSPNVRGSSEEQMDKASWSQSRPLRKVARLPPPPHLDAPLSPQPVPRREYLASVPGVEGLSPDTEGSMEQRSSSVPLEPREHIWLVKVATGSWMQVRALLHEDPHLATRKDFVSGYTVLHWLAKHGNAQVLQEVVASVRKAGVALDVNAKSGCGYTPLHLAAIHGHQLVIKVLVQKLRCLVQVRDSSGKKPWQYLSNTTSGEVWQLLGAPRDKTIFSTRPITRTASSSSSLARNSKSPQLARKVSRKASLAAYLKPQHIKWKVANKYPPLQEREEYSD